MKFYVDAMFGNLSRFLRVLGYDCLLRSNTQNTDDYFCKVIEENRIIITRSRVLYNQARKRDIKAIFINKEGIVNILCELKRKININLTCDPNNSRCSDCNGLLVKTDKNLIKKEVNSGTFEHFEEFWKCKSCGKIYWEGAHWADIRRKIKQVKECVGNEN
ncbi:MAG: Mut7-C RNAse domain-containing protein [Candidatus Heimdallarchaeum aukensis]|uniref:Mut7-C RNAse domain-containing protein n=1 Tax=Candidatus Heimdallarchaeum aukensis TaxID=2876573 RepID=A0A9Y1FKJ9_9ARCH|nr:MAG: Mut7-C RNAse domain-containing protein [Candidatus Heimdallarchaeum aukensis]